MIDSFYASHRTSLLLMHPHAGLKLLECYIGMKDCDPNSKPEDDTVLANALSTVLADVLMHGYLIQ
jgi:hypothetical protein